MTALRTAAGTAVPLVVIEAVLDALHAEVVPAGNGHRIPENLAADPTAEVVHPHRDTRPCHVSVIVWRKAGCHKSGFVSSSSDSVAL